MTQLETTTDIDRCEWQYASDATRDADVERDALVMLIDDEPINVTVARKFLERAGYTRFVEITDATEAVARCYAEEPDVLLLDLMMPHVSGLDILATLREDSRFATLPIVVLTASTDAATRARALNLGATDFLAKPVDPVELVPRVRNALGVKRNQDRLERLVRERTLQLERSRREVILCLARAAEYRDCETGRHTQRVGRYAGVIARRCGLDPDHCDLIEMAATLHDLGKIGVPDNILLKPGRLTSEEFDTMKRHTSIGEHIIGPNDGADLAEFFADSEAGLKILDGCRSPILKLASRIARSHHERYDGTGYPSGLIGAAIPLEGRITAVADVFDALGSARPYKPAFPLEKCFTILDEGRGTQFDPEVLDAFFAGRHEILEIYETLGDG